MSPARSHVEQSRNTLLFASCAKEVSTNAQVNVVMSEKVLVKHLQRELARLQTELRTAVPTRDSATLLREKELMIEQVFCKTMLSQFKEKQEKKKEKRKKRTLEKCMKYV